MDATNLVGEIIDGRYRIDAAIGEGAMGSVYRAERVQLGRAVAVKLMNDEIPDEASSRRRFEREAIAMAKLEHPHCASVLDVGMHGDRPFVVMELVRGQTLKELIAAGPLPVQRAIAIMRQVLAGLAHVHERGIIHRDIKPSNIALASSDENDHAKILDFGLARIGNETSALTSGFALGTPQYMAPEQVRGVHLDHRVDLYACGLVLFELLTGVKPYGAPPSDPLHVCMQHLNAAPARLADVRSGIAFGPLEDIVLRALAKDPAHRFANADEMARALADAARALDAAPAPDPTIVFDIDSSIVHEPALPPARVAPRKLSPRTHLVIAGAALVTSIAVLAAVLSREPTREATAAPRVEAPPPAVIDEPIEMQVDPVADLVATTRELASSGRRENALDLLLDAHKTHPDDARIPYEASRLYLEKMWWADGLKYARAAFVLDPELRSDRELTRLVVRAFNTTPGRDAMLGRFLRDEMTASAKDALEDTAHGHPNPIVRARATAELRRY
jgi:serine/threonine protein kinase